MEERRRELARELAEIRRQPLTYGRMNMEMMLQRQYDVVNSYLTPSPFAHLFNAPRRMTQGDLGIRVPSDTPCRMIEADL